MSIILILCIFIGLLIVWNTILTVFVMNSKKNYNEFFSSGNKNLSELLQGIILEHRKVNARSANIEKALEEINKVLLGSYQKMFMIRYNPFKDTGGDQSFSLALLDLNNSGIVITSIQGREVNRVYAKTVEKGKSTYNLSAEEIEAISKAVIKK